MQRARIAKTFIFGFDFYGVLINLEVYVRKKQTEFCTHLSSLFIPVRNASTLIVPLFTNVGNPIKSYLIENI